MVDEGQHTFPLVVATFVCLIDTIEFQDTFLCAEEEWDHHCFFLVQRLHEMYWFESDNLQSGILMNLQAMVPVFAILISSKATFKKASLLVSRSIF